VFVTRFTGAPLGVCECLFAHLLHWHFVTSRLQSLAACDIVIILRASYGEYAVTAAAAATDDGGGADGAGDAGDAVLVHAVMGFTVHAMPSSSDIRTTSVQRRVPQYFCELDCRRFVIV